MPCYTISSYNLAWVNMDQGMMTKALLAEGYQQYGNQFISADGQTTVTLGSGSLNVRGGTVNEADLRKAYGRETMKTAAKKFGWQMKEQKKGSKVVWAISKRA